MKFLKGHIIIIIPFIKNTGSHFTHYFFLFFFSKNWQTSPYHTATPTHTLSAICQISNPFCKPQKTHSKTSQLMLSLTNQIHIQPWRPSSLTISSP